MFAHVPPPRYVLLLRSLGAPPLLQQHVGSLRAALQTGASASRRFSLPLAPYMTRASGSSQPHTTADVIIHAWGNGRAHACVRGDMRDGRVAGARGAAERRPALTRRRLACRCPRRAAPAARRYAGRRHTGVVVCYRAERGEAMGDAAEVRRRRRRSCCIGHSGQRSCHRHGGGGGRARTGRVVYACACSHRRGALRRSSSGRGACADPSPRPCSKASSIQPPGPIQTLPTS